MSAPETFLASEPVLALRTWTIKDNRLCGWTYHEIAWLMGAPTVATCFKIENSPTHVYGTPSFECSLSDGLSPHVEGRCGTHALSVDAIRDIETGCYEDPGGVRGWIRYDTEPSGSRTYMGEFVAHYPRSELCYPRSELCGIVAMWGRVILGDTGVYRAEYAYPVVLFDSQDTPAVAENYGALVVPAPLTLPALREVFEYARTKLKEVTPR